MGQTRSGINRALMWLRKTLEITELTDSPQVLSEVLRPTIDVFGWDRLSETVFDSPFVAAPGLTVNSDVTPDDVLRVYLHAAVRHTDAGVTHTLWIQKLANVGGISVGVTSPFLAVPVGVPIAAQQWILVEPGARLQGRAPIALVAGAIAMDLNFVDLPIGEYIHR